jgi:peptidyl-tRNA hydrolase
MIRVREKLFSRDFFTYELPIQIHLKQNSFHLTKSLMDSSLKILLRSHPHSFLNSSGDMVTPASCFFSLEILKKLAGTCSGE